MKRHARLVVPAVLAIAAGILGLALRDRGEIGSAPERDARTGAALEELVYDLHYETDDAKSAGSGSVSSAHRGTLAIDAQLVVREIVGGPGPTSVAISLGEIERFEMTMNDEPVLAGAEAAREAFAGLHVVVERDASGSIVALRRPEARNAAPFVLELLALETQVGGEGRERSPHGALARTVERGERTITRRWDRYLSFDIADLGGDGDLTRAQVDGDQRADLRADGVVARLEGRESIAWANRDDTRSIRVATRYELALASTRAARGAIALGDLIRHPPGVQPVSADSERRMLEARAEGMTGEELASTLAMYGNGGQVPDHTRFLWRAVALLQLDPEAGDALRDIALDPGTTLAGRQLILDLLAQGGAEEALLAVIRSDVVRGGEHEMDLIQRVAMLPAPSSEVARYLEARISDLEGDVSMASEYALGTVALRLAEQGDIAGATAARGIITRELERAEDPSRIAQHLTALGNAVSPDDVERIAEYADHEEDRVRIAAARALGRTDTPAGRARLVAMLGDANGEVQRSALDSLGDGTLDRETLGAIAGSVRDGALRDETLGDVYAMLPSRAAEDPESVRAILDAIEARGVDDPALRARTGGLRRTLEGRPHL